MIVAELARSCDDVISWTAHWEIVGVLLRECAKPTSDDIYVDSGILALMEISYQFRWLR